MSAVAVIVVVGTCIVVVASLALDDGEPATASSPDARAGWRARLPRRLRRRAGAHARSKEPAVVGGPTTPTEVAPAQPILPAVATPPVEPEPQPLLAFAPPAPAGDEPPELMVRPPATEPLLVPARDPVVPSVQDDIPAPTPVRRRPRGEPVKQSSLLHRLGSAILLGFLSALLGVVAAAAIGIAALAVFVLIRGAVG